MNGAADRPLAAYQEEALRLFFAPTASDEELSTLGPPERWRVYRNMVRVRIEKVVRAAFPRTLAACGEDESKALLVSFFAEAPPTTRWFRELPLQFADFLSARWPENAPEYAPDLLAFERARWEVRHQETRLPRAIVDLDFALEPAVTPALRRLRVRYRVDRLPPSDAPQTPPEPGDAILAIYRRRDDRPSTWALNDIAGALLDEFVDGSGSLTERVQAVTQARGVAIDQAFLEGLSTLLADFIERGLVLGCFAAE